MGSFTHLSYHVVFATKYRKRAIVPEISGRLYEYIGGILRATQGELLEIGGVEDHVHILARLSANHAVADVLRQVKACSSKWFNELPGLQRRFQWQKGYAAFTVSYSHVEAVGSYIRNQAEHHRIQSFEEEYVAFLQKHRIRFRMEYLFEDEHHA